MMRKLSRVLRSLLLGPLLSVMIAACGSQDDENLQAWMDKVRSEVHPRPLPAPQPLVVRAVTYQAGDQPDPFDALKISAALNAASGNGLLPDLHRAREPLESYPLDSLHMVGSLRRAGQAVALIEADKMLYQVRMGNHLGQDQGTVIRIDESDMEIEELVQENAGGWSRRRTRLSIQEKK